jgi:hypothetical protein
MRSAPEGGALNNENDLKRKLKDFLYNDAIIYVVLILYVNHAS